MQGRGDRGRKEGGRRGGEHTLRIPLTCSLPVSHAGGPHVESFVVDRLCVCLRACVRAGVAQRLEIGFIFGFGFGLWCT